MAVKNLIRQQERTEDPKLKAILDCLAVRKCRILAGDTPENILVDISHRNHSGNKVVSKFKAPFMDAIDHARSQYHHFGKPDGLDRQAQGLKVKDLKFQVDCFTCALK